MMEENTEAAAEQAGPPWLDFLRTISQGETLVEKLGLIAMIIVLALLAYWIVIAFISRSRKRLEEEAEEANSRARQRINRAITVLGLIGNIAKWIIGIGAVLWILVVLGVPIAPLLAGAGVAGLAFGFGTQTLVKDLITGLFLLIEGQYAVGDYVEISGKFGLVQSIGLRVTVIKDLDNQLHYLPNGSIGAITVYEEPFVNYVVEAPVATREEAQKLEERIGGTIEDLLDEFPQHLPMAGPVCIDETERGEVVVRAPMGVFPTQEWLANDEMPARINQAMQELEITIPPGRQVRTYADLSRMPIPPRYEDVEKTADSLSLDYSGLIARITGCPDPCEEAEGRAVAPVATDTNDTSTVATDVSDD